MNSKYGYLSPPVSVVAKHIIRLFCEKNYRVLHRLAKIAKSRKARTPGVINLLGEPLAFLDTASLLSAWDLIMTQKIYDIGDVSGMPFILDCGTNIGIAQLYWKGRYREFESVAWEPDPEIYKIAQQNFTAWSLATELRPNALSDITGEMSFSSNNDDSGCLNPASENQGCRVPVERLGQFLRRPIDLLKLDIEGAEYDVLNDVRQDLGRVRNIFIEFHLRDRSNRLSNLLEILENAGFDYSIEDRVPHWKSTPFRELKDSASLPLRTGHIYARKAG